MKGRVNEEDGSRQRSIINNEIEIKQLRPKKEWSQEGKKTDLKILWKKKRKGKTDTGKVKYSANKEIYK